MSNYEILDTLIPNEVEAEGELVFRGFRDDYEFRTYYRNKPTKNRRARAAQVNAKRNGAEY